MFDPYRDWLGIAQPHRPLDGYSLLGLPLFESRPAVIAQAADRQLARVQQLQGTAYAAWMPNLTHEITVARNCLLSPAKLQYDEALRRAMQPQQAAPATVQEMLPPVAPEMDRPAEEPQQEVKPPASRRARVIALAIAGVVAVASFVGVWQLIRMMSSPGTPPEVAANDEAPTEPETPMPAEEESPAEETLPKKRPEPVLLNQEGNGEVNFTPITAELTGGIELISRGTDSVLGNWTSPSDSITWQFRLRRGDVFRLEITYAAPPEWEGTRYVVALDDEVKEHTTRTSGSLDKTVTDEFFMPITKPGEHRLSLQMVQKPGEQAMVLHRVRLAPTKLK